MSLWTYIHDRCLRWQIMMFQMSANISWHNLGRLYGIHVHTARSVGIYNDFTGSLYFLPGSENVIAQLTLYSFTSRFNSRWSRLFADVVVITILPLIMFMFFQRQIVSGMA